MKSISKTLAVLVILLVGNVAFAQYGTWAAHSVGGTQFWTQPGVVYNTASQQLVNPYYNGMPMQYGTPQYYGGGIPTGGVGIFERLGRLWGANHSNTIRATENGDFAGYLLDRLTASTPVVRQQVITPTTMVQTVAQPVIMSQPVYGQTIGAEQQVGGTAVVSRQVVRRESSCSIGSNPELQNLPLDEVKCKALRDAMRVTEPGHCTIGGVNYPELVDNEKGCLAKRDEITAQANAKAGNPGTPVSAADVKVDSSKGTAIANVCAWIHPTTKQRFDKPADFNGSCIDFVKKTAGSYGFSIAVRQ